MAITPRIQMAEEDEVQVIRFLDRRLFDEPVVREAADQLFAALPGAGPVRAILDFSNVEQISSSMLGKLILAQRRADASGGQLRLCELSPSVASVLRTTNLDRLFAVDRDLRAAREAIEAGGRA